VSSLLGVHVGGICHVLVISDVGDEMFVGVSIYYVRSLKGEQLCLLSSTQRNP